MSAAESIKSHLGNLFRSGKTAAALRLSFTVLLLFLVARAAADLTWQLGAPLLSKVRSLPAGQMPNQISSTTPKPAPKRVAPPAEEIALFGLGAGSSPLSGRASAEGAPPTTLNLMLKGVVAVRPMRRALAIIAERGASSEKLYSQGEEIAPNVVIKEIHPDRVIISRAGALETLFMEGFEKPSPMPGPAATKSGSRAADDYIQSRGDGINWSINQDYWADKLADVPGLAREVGMEVYSENNQQKGYRLVAVQNSALLKTLGLQPGDILLSVNGRAMSSVQEGLAAYQQIKSGGQVTIEINRNGRRETRVYHVSG